MSQRPATSGLSCSHTPQTYYHTKNNLSAMLRMGSSLNKMEIMQLKVMTVGVVASFGCFEFINTYCSGRKSMQHCSDGLLCRCCGTVDLQGRKAGKQLSAVALVDLLRCCKLLGAATAV